MSESVARHFGKLAERGGGDVAKGVKVTILEAAREVDVAAERLRQHMPLDKPEARRRILDVMKKGFSASAGADAIIAELQRLKAKGLYFDEDGITRVRST
jgi:hypothetical protein